jgi:hypothetical protein
MPLKLDCRPSLSTLLLCCYNRRYLEYAQWYFLSYALHIIRQWILAKVSARWMDAQHLYLCLFVNKSNFWRVDTFEFVMNIMCWTRDVTQWLGWKEVLRKAWSCAVIRNWVCPWTGIKAASHQARPTMTKILGIEFNLDFSFGWQQKEKLKAVQGGRKQDC